MKTERVTLTLADGRTIDGVRRHWPERIEYADMFGNVVPEDMIKEVCDAG